MYISSAVTFGRTTTSLKDCCENANGGYTDDCTHDDFYCRDDASGCPTWNVLKCSGAKEYRGDGDSDVTLAVPSAIAKVPATPAAKILNCHVRIKRNSAPVHGRIAIALTRTIRSRSEWTFSASCTDGPWRWPQFSQAWLWVSECEPLVLQYLCIPRMISQTPRRAIAA